MYVIMYNRYVQVYVHAYIFIKTFKMASLFYNFTDKN